MQEVLKVIIKEDISPIMKALGFTKHRNTFVKNEEGFQKTMIVQSSQWNTSQEVSFTIECGIFFPDMYLKIFPGKELPKYPQPVHCLHQYRKRIDAIRNRGIQWYDLKPDIDLDKLRKDIKWDIEWYVRKHFERYKEMYNFMTS